MRRENLRPPLQRSRDGDRDSVEHELPRRGDRGFRQIGETDGGDLSAELGGGLHRWNGGRCRYGIGVYIIVAAALSASAAGPQVSGGTARRDRPSSIRAPRPARREETGFKRKSMPKVLSDAADAQYQDQGYYFPVYVLSPAQAADRSEE